MAISVILPAFNEEEGVQATVEEIVAILDGAKFPDYEILVVDDGSDDGTVELAKAAGAEVVSNLQNMGYGYSVKRGIREARHDTIVITDADGTYPADRIPEMVERHRQGYDLVIGQRTGKHLRANLFRVPLRRVLVWIMEFTTGSRIPDANSGFRVFSRAKILPHLNRLSDKFSLTATMTVAYMLSHYYVIYVPIDYRERIGETTAHAFRDLLQTFQYLAQTILYYNPLKLFLVGAILIAVPSIASVIGGLGMGSPTTAFAGVLGVLVAVLVATLGFLSEQLRQILVQSDEK